MPNGSFRIRSDFVHFIREIELLKNEGYLGFVSLPPAMQNAKCQCCQCQSYAHTSPMLNTQKYLYTRCV